MSNKRVLIVGGVAGGASAAARLRRLDETAEIILFERGEYISYANCGLPYHVGDVISSRDALLLQTPQGMYAKHHVDVRTGHEVIAINRVDKTITVRKSVTDEVYSEHYDTLLLSTGSSPLRPPISGIDAARVMTLWTVPDADHIRAFLRDKQATRAVVVGGGFIGLEMAENLHRAGLEVSIVEMMDQVMAPLDYEMAQLLHEHLNQSGVNLLLGDGVSSFEETPDDITVHLKSGASISADLALLSIGVRPNSELARAAGLTVNARGGVVVDDHMRTSDPAIFAVGDVVEIEDLIFKGRTMVPLAGPANRQGRIAADNIAGGDAHYEGTQGTFVAQVFDLTAAATGANERTLLGRGMKKGRDYESVTIVQNSHAGYYPGATPLTLKLLFSCDGKNILGAQAIGHDGVDKRIDTIAVAIRLGGSVHALAQLELAYAPPYSSAKDPVNMAGFTAENLLSGLLSLSPWDVVEHCDPADTILLDVREKAERLAFSAPGTVGIPLGELRDRLSELDSQKRVVVFCAIGVRAYNAARILVQHGFRRVEVYPGGSRFYRSTHYRAYATPATSKTRSSSDGSHEEDHHHPASSASACMRLDCSGLQCPGPLMKVFEAMKSLPNDGIMEVSASDPGFASDIGAWCRRTGNALLGSEKRDNAIVVQIQKRTVDIQPHCAQPKQGKTIVVFSGDLDKALASFIIANGAAAMGRPVTMFFTFWGLNVLRRPQKPSIKKSMIEWLFGSMMPRGTQKLALSKMNMGGMGTAMMKKVMRDKNIESLEMLMQKARQAGVKLIACTMSMDVMGIRHEELIDGVELGGVGAYLGDAEEADVNLFI